MHTVVTVGFSSVNYYVNEGQAAEIEVKLVGAHTVDVTVDICISGLSVEGICSGYIPYHRLIFM